jgi:sugar phosphate isomerase/epimerase
MRTKLSFIGNNSLPEVEEDARFAAENGFEGLEYNYWGNFGDLSEDTVRAMHRIHKAYGVKCVMLGFWGWNHMSKDAEERAKAHAMLERGIEFGKILEADILTTGGGVYSEDLAENVAEFGKVFPSYLEKVRAAGMVSAFYAVHGQSFFKTLKCYEAVWENHPLVTIKYDPANWDHSGEDYIEVVRKHGDKVGHMHIKEHLKHGGDLASQPAAGMGDIEFGKVLAFLYEHHFNGPLSIEPHGPIWSKGEMRRKMLLLTQRHISPFLI